jgi:cardiolipin synthase
VSDRIERLSSCLAEGFRESLRAQKTSAAATSPAWAARLADLVQEGLAARGPAGLAQALRAAISLAAERFDQVSIAVTGPGWLGGGVPAVERMLADLIASAEQEVTLTAYSITPGSDRIWAEFEQALATGIRVTIVIDRLCEQNEVTRSLLYRLARVYSDAFSLYDFVGEDLSTGLHAKVLVVDRRVALVGSANLSHRGMVTAHEMATIVRGPTADRVAQRLDALIGSWLVARVRGGGPDDRPG